MDASIKLARVPDLPVFVTERRRPINARLQFDWITRMATQSLGWLR